MRFGEADSLTQTAAPQQSRMARGSCGGAAVARSELGVDEAARCDLPEGEPISDGDSYAEEGDATEAEQELDESMPRIPGACLIGFTFLKVRRRIGTSTCPKLHSLWTGAGRPHGLPVAFFRAVTNHQLCICGMYIADKVNCTGACLWGEAPCLRGCKIMMNLESASRIQGFDQGSSFLSCWLAGRWVFILPGSA